MEKKKFVELILLGAQETYRSYGILPSVTIAQAILESAWGESGLTKVSNNLFGIKWTSSCNYSYVEYPTKEYINGKYVNTKAKFRCYLTMNDSVVDHALFLTAARYKKVLSSTTYTEQCSQLQSCGYATDKDYAKKLISIIENNNLHEYDVMEDEDIETYVFRAGTTHLLEINGKKFRFIVTST